MYYLGSMVSSKPGFDEGFDKGYRRGHADGYYEGFNQGCFRTTIKALEPILKTPVEEKPLLPESIQLVNFNEKKGTTVVKWTDGTITKVKVQKGDTYNPEVGLAMCIAKRAMGNKGSYNDVFKKWLPKEKEV